MQLRLLAMKERRGRNLPDEIRPGQPRHEIAEADEILEKCGGKAHTCDAGHAKGESFR